MMIRWPRFNIYLLVGLAMVLSCGCQSANAKRKKVTCTLRVHGETRADASGKSSTVEIFRAQPFAITIDKSAFLTESNVKEAKVVDSMGGFSLQLKFDRKGTWLLEQLTAGLRGKHIAIFAEFMPTPEDKLGVGRWLAAPLIKARITDGVLTFTPDTSREEADQIALGLNNVAKKLETGKHESTD
jgi:hypothetical protein